MTIVTRCSVDSPACSLSTTGVTEGYLLNHQVERRNWNDEKARDVAVEKSRELRAEHGVDIPPPNANSAATQMNPGRRSGKSSGLDAGQPPLL